MYFPIYYSFRFSFRIQRADLFRVVVETSGFLNLALGHCQQLVPDVFSALLREHVLLFRDTQVLRFFFICFDSRLQTNWTWGSVGNWNASHFGSRRFHFWQWLIVFGFMKLWFPSLNSSLHHCYCIIEQWTVGLVNNPFPLLPSALNQNKLHLLVLSFKWLIGNKNSAAKGIFWICSLYFWLIINFANPNNKQPFRIFFEKLSRSFSFHCVVWMARCSVLALSTE